jgi:hypothetical protein
VISIRWVGLFIIASASVVVAEACGGGDDSGITSSPGDAGPDVVGVSESGSSEAGGPSLTITLHRVADAGVPNPISATLRVADESDAGLSGLSIDLSAAGQTIPVTEVGGGIYRASITPGVTSGEVPIVAKTTDGRASGSVTALVLTSVGDEWDQPIAIGGLVNTGGTEDSATISPDGEWLIVGTYEPIDTLCCVFHCGEGPPDGRNSACQTVTGPYAAPARPNMPGAERILSPTRVVQASNRMCVTSPDGGDFTLDFPDGGTLVPTISVNGAYGFHRQADGTFAEPFLIGFQDDGFGGGPFCFSFVAPVTGGKANVVFAYKREDDFVNSAHHPTATTLTLGSDNVLGTYSCDGGVVDYRPGAISELPVSPATQNAGNTSVGGGYLWSDDENVNPAVPLSAQLFADGGVAPWTSLALPIVTDDRRQPVLRNGRIYYYRNATVTSLSWNGGDPSNAASFGAPTAELVGDSIPAGGPLMLAPGLVAALGQPTFALRSDGTTEMVFVYYKRTATGFDGQIGRVPSR